MSSSLKSNKLLQETAYILRRRRGDQPPGFACLIIRHEALKGDEKWTVEKRNALCQELAEFVRRAEPGMELADAWLSVLANTWEFGLAQSNVDCSNAFRAVVLEEIVKGCEPEELRGLVESRRAEIEGYLQRSSEMMTQTQWIKFADKLNDLYSGLEFGVEAFGEKNACVMKASTYALGGLALQLLRPLDYAEGRLEPYATLTVWLDEPLMNGCVWVKTWGENSWVQRWFEGQTAWFELTGRMAPAGWATAIEVRLKDGQGNDAWPLR